MHIPSTVKATDRAFIWALSKHTGFDSYGNSVNKRDIAMSSSRKVEGLHYIPGLRKACLYIDMC